MVVKTGFLSFAWDRQINERAVPVEDEIHYGANLVQIHPYELVHPTITIKLVCVCVCVCVCMCLCVYVSVCVHACVCVCV